MTNHLSSISHCKYLTTINIIIEFPYHISLEIDSIYKYLCGNEYRILAKEHIKKYRFKILFLQSLKTNIINNLLSIVIKY